MTFESTFSRKIRTSWIKNRLIFFAKNWLISHHIRAKTRLIVAVVHKAPCDQCERPFVQYFREILRNLFSVSHAVKPFDCSCFNLR